MEIEAYSAYDDTIRSDSSVQEHVMDNRVKELRENALSYLAKAYQLSDCKKIQKEVKAMNANANAEIKAKIEWGGEDGVVYTFTGSASASNDNGDHVDVSVSQDTNGNVSVEVSAGAGTDTGNGQK